MTIANRRKKNPELVKQSIIDCAAALAASEGVTNLSIQKVATMAGVTKGGVLHHFPSRRHLMDALYGFMIAQAEKDLTLLMGDDREYGCFTRAYIRGMTNDVIKKAKPPQVTLSMLLDTELCALWREWLNAKLAAHNKTDGGKWLEMLRYSADGIWLAASVGTFADFESIQKRLIAATYKEVEI